ncbi:hypothetical protein [Bdellovibrio sp. HCB337]|uniref:hypothetical protein n=1 Tax=Bdellovibrio sp. HCB337 TaxID=3394358 RepID=UPI0039A56BA1
MKLLSLVFVTALAINAQAADKIDAKYFELTKMTRTDVTEQYDAKFGATTFAQAGLYENCNTGANNGTNGNMVTFAGEAPELGLGVLDQAEVIIDQVINLGKKIWAVVETGRPVVNVQAYTANALPKGVQCWSDLSGWQIPQSKVYRVQYENAYGMKVVDFAYRVTFTAGGSVNGQGKYITNATIMPADVNVSWGFTFNASAEVPSVFNTGSKEDPVAGMQLLMKWSVDTVMNHVEQAETFYIGGDNTLKHLE